MTMDGITVHILGDSSSFSRVGKSIGYKVTVGGQVYLIDCGTPLFQQIGGHGLKELKGLIITHCHDDHKRWFSDLALFHMYAPDFHNKVSLITSESVHEDLIESSMPVIGKSLSKDSKNIVDMAFQDYIDYRMIGPEAGYKITATHRRGKTLLCVTDRQDSVLPPDMAKIVVSNKTGKPRMLFKDPDYGEWIEPESFYSFSSSVFYGKDRNVLLERDGCTIEAIKSPVWHGVPAIGIKIKYGADTLIFSSDTVHDRKLWKQLCSEKRPQMLRMSKKEFESASVIYGDINDYIERTWSEERYRDAINAFSGAAVIHDISVRNSVVHTDYEKLDNTTLRKDRVLLTHGPDRFTSEWALSNAGKTFVVRGCRFLEMVDGELFPLDADIYHKEEGKFYVGYRNKHGKYPVYEKKGLLQFASYDGSEVGRHLFNVDLYEDIGGKYFPKLENGKCIYLERSDGRVELLKFTEEGSRGKIAEDQRVVFAKKRNKQKS